MPDSGDVVVGLPEPQAEERLSSKYPTRELGRLIKYYRENIKDYGKTVPMGTMRNIQGLIDAGIALEDIVKAMHTYAAARKGQDPQYTLGVRSFFCKEKVEYWLDPPQWTQSKTKPTLPEIRFTPTERPKPAVPLQEALPIEEDDNWTL